MWTELFVSGSVTAAATAVFAFRYAMWGEPWRLLRYYAILFAAELAAERFLLPPGALGPELAFVCLGITALFGVASVVKARFDE
jgi:hypothetical protein